jgi:hypothetical protein
MTAGDDDRPATKVVDDGPGAAGTPSRVTPRGSAEPQEPVKPPGTESWVQAAEAGDGEVRATKDTPEPDSLGG